MELVLFEGFPVVILDWTVGDCRIPRPVIWFKETVSFVAFPSEVISDFDKIFFILRLQETKMASYLREVLGPKTQFPSCMCCLHDLISWIQIAANKNINVLLIHWPPLQSPGCRSPRHGGCGQFRSSRCNARYIL